MLGRYLYPSSLLSVIFICITQHTVIFIAIEFLPFIFIFNTVFFLLRLICALVAVYIFYLVLIFAMSYIMGACIVAVAHLYCICGLSISLLYIVIASFQTEFVVVEPYIIYKAIYNNTFLDKEFLYSQYIYTNNKGAIYSTNIFFSKSIATLISSYYFCCMLSLYFPVKVIGFR